MSPFASLGKERFEPLNELLIVGRTGHGHATEDVPPDAHQSLEATALLLPDAHAPAHRAQQCADVWWQVETEGQGHLENQTQKFSMGWVRAGRARPLIRTWSPLPRNSLRACHRFPRTIFGTFSLCFLDGSSFGRTVSRS